MARISAPQIAVQKKLSMVRCDESASTISSSTALMTIANRPSVRMMIGSVMIRRNVPTIALTMPNSSEIQRYAKKPPVIVIPERIQVVMANAAAITSHQMMSQRSIAGKHASDAR